MGAVSLLVIASALAAFAVPALAHVPDASALPGHPDPGWSFEPWVVVLLVASLTLYGTGVARLWRHARPGRGIAPRQVAAFVGGWIALVVALVSPLDTLGSQLFSAHMVQHELLMLVAAPLLVLGRPLAAWTWAFAPVQRRAMGRAVNTGAWAAFWSCITDPLAAWALHAIALWTWHVPALFDAAVGSEPIHALQHASFLGTALLFWWPTLGCSGRSRRHSAMAMAYLFTTMLHTAALGALLTLAPTPWYAPYVSTTAAFGFDPLQDQQLGGLVMWVPGGLAYLVAGLLAAARVLAPQRLEAPRKSTGVIDAAP